MCGKYCVEFSHNEFDVKAETAEKAYAEIRSCDECVHFCGLCKDIDEDVYYVRFADNGLDMVDIPENRSDIKIGDYISFNVKYGDLEIYPY